MKASEFSIKLKLNVMVPVVLKWYLQTVTFFSPSEMIYHVNNWYGYPSKHLTEKMHAGKLT